MKNNDLQFLQAELSRVSEWIQFADKKAGFVAVFYSAILGLLITKRDEIFIQLFWHGDCLYGLLLLALLIVLGVGAYHLISTVSPQLKNGNTNRSLFFFGTVAKMKIDDYLKDIKELTEEDAKREVAEQIHTNSVIANAKMTSVRKSTFALMYAGVLVFLLFFIF
jgi:hypothetical protein